MARAEATTIVPSVTQRHHSFSWQALNVRGGAREAIAQNLDDCDVESEVDPT
jgi:hypothetical protein